jgi:hypothetical protein
MQRAENRMQMQRAESRDWRAENYHHHYHHLHQGFLYGVNCDGFYVGSNGRHLSYPGNTQPTLTLVLWPIIHTISVITITGACSPNNTGFLFDHTPGAKNHINIPGIPKVMHSVIAYLVVNGCLLWYLSH